MATANPKPVRQPIVTIAIIALGTVRSGDVHSSARCRTASIPPYIDAGVTRPVKNVTPAGQPVWLSNVVHTLSEEALEERARHVTKIIRNMTRLRATEYLVSPCSTILSSMGVLTTNAMCPGSSLQAKDIVKQQDQIDGLKYKKVVPALWNKGFNVESRNCEE